MSTANDFQEGGTHYKSGYQHWDFMLDTYGTMWLVACASKYVARWRKKNGLEDLRKARHYVTKYHEAVSASAPTYAIAPRALAANVETFVRANGVERVDALFLYTLMRARDADDVLWARHLLDTIIARAQLDATTTAEAVDNALRTRPEGALNGTV
jgi:hypothetical protein